MQSITAPAINKHQRALLVYIGKLGAIWLAWKLIIFILGEQKEPLNSRMLPQVSDIWEQFNQLLVVKILGACKLMLTAIGYTVHTFFRTIWIADTPGVTVGNYCLGLQLIFYFVTLVLITPMSIGRKILGVVGGIVLVNTLNVVRIGGLALVAHHTPQYLFIAHDHIFNILVLGCMLPFFWLLAKKKPTGLPAAAPLT